MATCQKCGGDFTVSAAQQERFPGWTPPECPACFRAGRGGGKGARGRGGSRGGGRRATASREENLTLAAVLEKYHDGPQDGVFTDGSAVPNPGPGGWGAVWVREGEVVAQQHGHDPDTTNNRMELAAIQAALDMVPAGEPVTIWTDSKLAVDTLTKWARGWEAKGWRRKGGEIKNLDLVRPLYETVRERPEVTIEWIAAHAGNRWNEYADSLATAWARDEL